MRSQLSDLHIEIMPFCFSDPLVGILPLLGILAAVTAYIGHKVNSKGYPFI